MLLAPKMISHLMRELRISSALLDELDTLVVWRKRVGHAVINRRTKKYVGEIMDVGITSVGVVIIVNSESRGVQINAVSNFVYKYKTEE